MKNLNIADRVFYLFSFLLAFCVSATLVCIFVNLIIGSKISIASFGYSFIFSSEWNPVTHQFGALIPLIGTLVTSALAIILGLPISFGIAFFITEIIPQWVKLPFTILIELLAVVPSIIYGMWGLFVFSPKIGSDLASWLMSNLGDKMIVGKLFTGSSAGINILTAGIILGIMIIPFITSSLKDAFDLVPKVLKESAYGMGCTTWEVFWNITIPYTKNQILGGVMLGLGRALGETMAVSFVIGNAYSLTISLLMPGNTISSSLANEFSEAESEIYTAALMNLGLILFIITAIVLAISQFLLKRASNKEKL